MLTLGYVLAVVMGATLGLIGAGGSILTVPILVYLMGVPPLLATGYSLLLVGSAALVGSISYWRQGLVEWRVVLMFVVPSMASVLLTRLWIVPAIPDPVFGVSKAIVLMLFFACLMMVAALFMLKSSSEMETKALPLSLGRLAKMTLGSAGVGFLSGMVGAGGGFLIIPSLMALFGLPIKKAIGASLTIIAINSLVGFAGDVSAGIALDWGFLSRFLSLTLLGMALGMVASRRIQAASLKKGLGVFTLLIGFFVLMQSIFSLY